MDYSQKISERRTRVNWKAAGKPLILMILFRRIISNGNCWNVLMASAPYSMEEPEAAGSLSCLQNKAAK